MYTDVIIQELEERLRSAARALERLGLEYEEQGRNLDSVRVFGKTEGVLLALTYLQEEKKLYDVE